MKIKYYKDRTVISKLYAKSITRLFEMREKKNIFSRYKALPIIIETNNIDRLLRL